MDRRYRFDRVHLIRSPGFPAPPFGIITGFSPALNILYGPNGIGKSTLIRAMRSLLSPTPSARTIDAEATLTSAEERYTLRLEYGHLSQVRAESGEAVILPGRGDELSDAYFFGLHELLSDVGDNPLFIARVRSEMQGGIDIEEARVRSGALLKFPPSTIAETKEEASFAKRVDEIKAAIAKNSMLLDQLKALKERGGDEEGLRREQQLVRGALSYLQRVGEAVALGEQIATFDKRLARMDSATLSQLEALHERADAIDVEHTEAHRRVRETQKAIEAVRIEEVFVADQSIGADILRLVDELKSAQSAYQEAVQAASDATSALGVWQQELSWIVASPVERPTLQAMVQTLSSLSGQCESLRARVVATQMVRKALGSSDPNIGERLSHEQVRKDRVVRLIAVTGRLGQEQEKRGSVLWWLPLLLFALSALVAQKLPQAAIVGSAVAIAVTLLLRWQKRDGHSGELERERAQLLHLLSEDLDGSSARVEELVRLLERISAKIAELEAERVHQGRIEASEQEVADAQEAYNRWLEAYGEASRALHLLPSPLLDGAQFFNFSDRLASWIDRSEKVAIAQARQEIAHSALIEARRHLRERCALTESSDDALINDARLFSQSIAEAQSLSAALQERMVRLERAEEERVQSRSELDRFYANLGFEDCDREAVKRLYRQWSGYAALTREKESVERELARFGEEEIALGAASDEAVLAVRLEAIEADLAASLERKRLEGSLEERYAQLSNSRELEQAVYEHQERQRALEAHRLASVQGRLIQLLHDQIKEESERRYQPLVVQKASDWLSAITRGRYTIGVGQEGFTAYDTVTERAYQITELSSGSRIQLLFSIRMGFLEVLEAGRDQQLPIFFDEVMANSDDERSLAIAEAIAAISAKRQVFYATAQLDEVDKLKAVVTEPITVFDLEAITQNTTIARRPFVAVAAKVQLPAEPNPDYNAYSCDLGVERASLFEPVGALHSWYVATESSELYGLLMRGLRKTGQCAYADSRYEARLLLLKAANRLAKVGRPRPLTVSDLSDERLPIKRDVGYFQQIRDFLDDGEKSGNDLIKALEDRTIKGVRESMKEALTAWLIEGGYATHQSMLSTDDILSRLAVDHPTLTIDSAEYQVVARYLASLGIE